MQANTENKSPKTTALPKKKYTRPTVRTLDTVAALTKGTSSGSGGGTGTPI